jgi:hypothetical protein
MEKIKEVKDLLEKYFNAETTLKEEQLLRDFFKGEVSDEELLVYKPMFNCFTEEIDKLDTESSTGTKRQIHFRWISVAAAAALALFTFVLLPDRGDSLKLMIDGVNVRNREMALNKADAQMSQINSMMQRFSKGSDQLEGLGKMGSALSPLNSLGRVLTQND